MLDSLHKDKTETEAGKTIRDFLLGNGSPKDIDAVDEFVLERVSKNSRILDIDTIDLLVRAIDTDYGVPADDLFSFAFNRYGKGDLRDAYAFAEALWQIFDLSLGIKSDPNSLIETFPELRFNDNLLSGPNDLIEWTKNLFQKSFRVAFPVPEQRAG